MQDGRQEDEAVLAAGQLLRQADDARQHAAAPGRSPASESRPKASSPSSSTAKFRLLFSSAERGATGRARSASAPAPSRGGSIRGSIRAAPRSSLNGAGSGRPARPAPAGSLHSTAGTARRSMACASADTRRKASWAVLPSVVTTGVLARICSLRPETRISKNSSRLLETMHRKRKRSSSGMRSSSAWASTRRLKASRPSFAIQVLRSESGVSVRLARHRASSMRSLKYRPQDRHFVARMLQGDYS